MHVAAMAPQFRSRDDVKEEDIKAAREVFEKETASVPEVARAKAVEGKLNSYLSEKVLLEQLFVKDSNITIRGLIESATQKFGEKIEITRFERLAVK
ncbi:MAG: Elongation factor Ts [Candidatus Adlerbacteria bacterium GW2011_GWC1_50_9]|nr:MAG: Elongation factor Ts [Candidatus Adlerbacteria bacterium GW2011_GWC1_50_9]